MRKMCFRFTVTEVSITRYQSGTFIYLPFNFLTFAVLSVTPNPDTNCMDNSQQTVLPAQYITINI